MKRKLQPVVQTEKERRIERRFTRRMALLAMTGAILGVGVQALRAMGRPPPVVPQPAGAPPPPRLDPQIRAETPPIPGVAPTAPRLRGK